MTQPTLPSPKHPITQKGEVVNSIWHMFFHQIWQRLGSGEGIILTAIYTVATLPTAANFTSGIIYVSDETGGATLAFSDGTNWRRVQDRAIVS